MPRNKSPSARGVRPDGDASGDPAHVDQPRRGRGRGRGVVAGDSQRSHRQGHAGYLRFIKAVTTRSTSSLSPSSAASEADQRLPPLKMSPTSEREAEAKHSPNESRSSILTGLASHIRQTARQSGGPLAFSDAIAATNHPRQSRTLSAPSNLAPVSSSSRSSKHRLSKLHLQTQLPARRSLRVRQLQNVAAAVSPEASSPKGFAGRNLLKKIASDRSRAQALRVGGVSSAGDGLSTSSAGRSTDEGGGAVSSAIARSPPSKQKADEKERVHRSPRTATRGDDDNATDIVGAATAANDKSNPSSDRTLLPALNPVMQVLDVVVGVSAERAAHALAQCRWDVEAAINLLVDIESKLGSDGHDQEALDVPSTAKSAAHKKTSDSFDGGMSKESNIDPFSSDETSYDDDDDIVVSAGQRDVKPATASTATASGRVQIVNARAIAGAKTDILSQAFGAEDSEFGLSVGVPVCKFVKRNNSAELSRQSFQATMPGLIELAFTCTTHQHKGVNSPDTERSPPAVASERALVQRSRLNEMSRRHPRKRNSLLRSKTIMLKVTKNDRPVHEFRFSAMQSPQPSETRQGAANSTATGGEAGDNSNDVDPFELKPVSSDVFEIRNLSPLNQSMGRLSVLLELEENDIVAWEWTVADGREVSFGVLFQPDSSRTIEGLLSNVAKLQLEIAETRQVAKNAKREQDRAAALVDGFIQQRQRIIDYVLASADNRTSNVTKGCLLIVKDGEATASLGKSQEKLLWESAAIAERRKWQHPEEGSKSSAHCEEEEEPIQLVQLRKRLSSTNAELARLQGIQAAIPKQLVLQRQINTALKREVLTLKDTIKTLRAQLTKSGLNLDAAQQTIADLRKVKGDADIVQARCDHLQKQIEALHEEDRLKRRRIAQLTATVFDSKKTMEKMKIDLQLESESSDKYRREAQNTQTKLQNLQSQVSDLQKERENGEKKLQALLDASKSHGDTSYWAVKKVLHRANLLLGSFGNVDSNSNGGQSSDGVQSAASFTLAFGSAHDPSDNMETALRDLAKDAKVLLAERSGCIAYLNMLKERETRVQQQLDSAKSREQSSEQQTKALKEEVHALQNRLQQQERNMASLKTETTDRFASVRKRETDLRAAIKSAEDTAARYQASCQSAQETASAAELKTQEALRELNDTKLAAAQLRVHNTELKAALAELYRTQGRMQGLLRVYKRQIGRRNFLKLFEFAKTGDWDKVFERLPEFPNCVYYKHPLSGDTLLHVAAACANEQAILTLIKHNSSKTIANVRGETPHMIVGRGVDLASGDGQVSPDTEGSTESTKSTDPHKLAHRSLQRVTTLEELLQDEGISPSSPTKSQRLRKHRLSKLSGVAQRILRCAKILRPVRDAWTCKICYEGRIDTVILPCGHLVACKECGERLSDKACPVCQQKIHHVNLVYLPDA